MSFRIVTALGRASGYGSALLSATMVKASAAHLCTDMLTFCQSA